MTRLEANREILAILADHIEKAPDIRFGQLLVNLGVLDRVEGFRWYIRDCAFTESEVTLRRTREGAAKLEALSKTKP